MWNTNFLSSSTASWLPLKTVEDAALSIIFNHFQSFSIIFNHFQSFSIFNLGFLKVSHLASHQPPLSIPTSRCSKQGHLCTRDDCRCQVPRCLFSQIPSGKVDLTRSMVIMQVVTSGHPFGFNARFQDLPVTVIYCILMIASYCNLSKAYVSREPLRLTVHHKIIFILQANHMLF